MRSVLVTMLFLFGLGTAAAQPCDPCALPDGTYRAVPPPNWDGMQAMPLLLFVHGWQSSADNAIADADISGPAARQGFLLIAPDGRDKRWRFRGSMAGSRDDIAFLRAVVADAEARFPVDRHLVIAAGFSIGGSLMWDLACHAASGFTAFLPLSGGFWEPLPADCDSGAVNLRHTHGLADTTFPLAGRAAGRGMRQGDVRQGFAVWRAINGCPEGAATTNTEADLTCTTWHNCAGGRELQLCLHPGGHMIEGRHLETGLRWARGLPVLE